MNEKTDPKIKWLIFVSLVSVLLVLITGSLVWDFVSEDFKKGKANDLGRIGYLPMETANSPPQNIAVRNIEWTEYLDNPDNYDIDLLIVGDSFSSAGDLPSYLATKNDIQVLAIPVAEVRPLQGDISPINLLTALDNGGVIDLIHPDCIILESVPRLLYSQTKNVNFSSNITPEQLKNTLVKSSTTENPPPLNRAGNESVKGDRRNISRKSTDRVIEIWTDMFSEKMQTWKDPVQIYFDGISERMINIRQMFFSLIWLNVYGHSYAIEGQPSITYRFSLDEPFFSSERNPNSLYVVSGDLGYLTHVNDTSWIYQYNLYLNTLEDRLAKKNITFYFMPAVDKYDFYYPGITNKPYPANTFYTDLESQYKAYYYINSKQILEKKLKNKDKDIFWQSDTHWSWMAVEYLATEISPVEPLTPKKFSLNESIERLPSDPQTLYSYAIALSNTGQYTPASRLMRKAFELENGLSLPDLKLDRSSSKLNTTGTFGTVQQVLQHDEYLEITGWAIDPVQNRPAKFVLITDSNQNIITISMIDQKKPGVVSRLNNEIFLVSGWTARIDNDDLTHESFPLHVYVIGSGQKVAYLIPSNEILLKDSTNRSYAPVTGR